MNADQRTSLSRVVRGEIASQAANVAVKAIGLANSFLVLSALSVYHFGLYQLILSAFLIADSFSAGLFDDVAINDTARGLAEGEASRAKRLFNEFAAFKVIVGLLATAVLFFGAEVIARVYDSDVAALVRLTSVFILISSVRAAEEIFFIATVSFSGLWTQAVQEAVKLVALIALLLSFGLAIKGVLLATIAGAGAALVFSSIFFVREYREAFGGVLAAREFLLARALRVYGFWVFTRYAFGKVIKQMRQWLIAVFLNTEAVAFYTLAVNLVTLVQSVFPVSMIGRIFPWQAKDPRRLAHLFARSVKYMLWGGVAATGAAVFIVPPAVSFILPEYAPAMPLFRLMALALPLYGVYKLYKSLLLVLREQKVLTARVLAEALATAGLNAVFLPAFGVIGAGFEYIVTYTWRVGLFHQALRRRYPELSVNLASLVRFDRDDAALLRRMVAYAVRTVGRSRPDVSPLDKP